TDVTLGLRLANPAWLGELYIVLWGLGLFVVLAIVNAFTGVLSARTTIFLSPALMIVVGAGIVRLRVGVRWSLLAGFVGVSLFLPPLIQPRLDYHVAAAALADRYQPGELVVLETGWDDNAFRYEIARQLPSDAEIIRTLPWVNNRDENMPVVPQIEETLLANERVWVVQWLQPSQVIPYLTEEAGYTATATTFTGVGDAYRGAFTAHGAADDVRIVRLARPADELNATFGDLFTLEGVTFDTMVTPGGVLTVDTRWTVQDTPELDYSVGLALMDDDGETVATLDLSLDADENAAYRYTLDDGRTIGDPTFYERPTSGWEPGDPYHATYAIPLGAVVPAGDYTLTAAVYHFESPEEPLLVDGEGRSVLGTVTVE
ncbi:MAG: hypothetical protein AAF125_06375, partial [Chloroflexota bacterium]